MIYTLYILYIYIYILNSVSGFSSIFDDASAAVCIGASILLHFSEQNVVFVISNAPFSPCGAVRFFIFVTPLWPFASLPFSRALFYIWRCGHGHNNMAPSLVYCHPAVGATLPMHHCDDWKFHLRWVCSVNSIHRTCSSSLRCGLNACGKKTHPALLRQQGCTERHELKSSGPK